MAERSFEREVQDLRLQAGEIFRGEGILAITKALLQSGVSYVAGYQGAPISHLMDVLADAKDVMSDLGVPAATQSAVNAAAAPVAGATDSILPIQATYYATMFASMPAKMLISMSNSMSASQAMQAGQQAMLANVTSILDSKMKAMLAGISGQMRGFGSAISAQLASAGKLGGLSVPNGWAQAAPEMVRAAPILPANSIAAPNVSAAMPNSPFTQALMGSLNGRGMVTQAAKTASVKVETRTPAGG